MHPVSRVGLVDARASYYSWGAFGKTCDENRTRGGKESASKFMSETPFRLTAHVVDVEQGRITPADVVVAAGRIAAIEPPSRTPDTFLTPGFIDAHVHVESSMLTPSEFARAATVHGTVATVSDPHEIGNVLGVEGVRFMLDNAARSPLKILFGAPACVPATEFETAGAAIGVEEVATLLDDPRIGYLSEVMNFPAVIRGDPIALGKIHAAQTRSKPVDGHAPQVRGDAARAYFAAGISTDHECVAFDEALEKISLGVRILIREGSAARNFDALWSLLQEHSDQCMFCTDDLHPDELLDGHINRLARRAVANGVEAMNVLRCACVNPVHHYGLDVGQLRVGDAADFIELNNLRDFHVHRTFIGGRLVAQDGKPLLEHVLPPVVNRFDRTLRRADEFRVTATSERMRVIEAIDGSLITRRLVDTPRLENGCAVTDFERDLLKIAVVNRYRAAPAAVAFITGFGLKRGAIASSVAHDSHNVVAIGTDDELLCTAVNRVIAAGGGLSAVGDNVDEFLPLPIAGLMSDAPYENVASAYSRIDRAAKHMGSPLRSPLMTLSFMALLVIPELKLSDRGLFDCARGALTPLFV